MTIRYRGSLETPVVVIVSLAVSLVVAAALTMATHPAQQSQSNDGAPSQVFTDYKNKCSYVVAGTDDGLHIVVNGASHCRGRILIDGVRAVPEFRASR